MRKEDGDDMIEEKRAKRPRGRGRDRTPLRGEEMRVNEDSGKRETERERGKESKRERNTTILFCLFSTSMFSFHMQTSILPEAEVACRSVQQHGLCVTGSLPYTPTAERTHTHTHTRCHSPTQAHRHTDTKTHSHTDTKAHRHTDTHTHRHTDTEH